MNISKDIIIVIVIIIIFIFILLCITFLSCKLNSNNNSDNIENNINSTHFDIIMNNQNISNNSKDQENIDNLSVTAIKNLQINNNIYPS